MRTSSWSPYCSYYYVDPAPGCCHPEMCMFILYGADHTSSASISGHACWQSRSLSFLFFAWGWLHLSIGHQELAFVCCNLGWHAAEHFCISHSTGSLT